MRNIIAGLAPRLDPSHLHTPDDPRVFVFGSNERGIHGGGAARYAYDKLGAWWDIGEGLMGRAYALPTCSLPGRPLPLQEVRRYVDRFLQVAATHPETKFFVSEVGCGLAGHSAEDIAPLFASAPDNCDLPPTWRTWGANQK